MPANCKESNGSAAVVLTQSDNIGYIEWAYVDEPPLGEAPVVEAEFVQNQAAGTKFLVTPYSLGRCPGNPKEVTIPSDLLVYNGVSNNGDGLNDFMVIECIQSFPQNNVKIYNRAGALVFELDGYDNSEEKAFKGVGNSGIYLGGNNDLPVGTYFYVINKNPDLDPETGFIEVVK